MRAIFVHFFDLAPHSGVSKKILYQIDALKECGMEVDLCYMDIDADGNQKRVCGNEILENYGNGLSGKLIKWFKFKALTNYILNNEIEFLYIRSIYNTNYSLLKMLKKLKKSGVKIVMEFPTYPYDNETKGAPISSWLIILQNLIFRNQLKNCLDRVVTFSDFSVIHGVKTIKISNGIDFNQIKLKSNTKNSNIIFNLIGVAEIRFWHGFDRVIKGMGNYYKTQGEYDVHFHIIGEGPLKELDYLKDLSREYKLEGKIHFYGNKIGDELDSLFEEANFGIASLGRHRTGITNIKTLKNREYAARGIPFIYSETDSDFDKMPYILKAKADDSPIDIFRIITFYRSLTMSPSEIRNTIVDTLTWKVQMQKVVNEMFKEK